jgi:hypothetical protein
MYGENDLKIGGKKMRLFVGEFGCYKATALQERREAGWRIRTWRDGKVGPAQDYWVENGQFSSIGENGDGAVARAERDAILNMIAKWEAEGLDQRSDNGQEAFEAAA